MPAGNAGRERDELDQLRVAASAMRDALFETLKFLDAPPGSPRLAPVARANLHALITAAVGSTGGARRPAPVPWPADSDELAAEAEGLAAELWPLVAPRLAGREPWVQSAVLADLLARWLAGFHLAGVPADVLRADLLASHVELVRQLVPINEAIAGDEAGGRA